jgi:HEAT repeat protein
MNGKAFVAAAAVVIAMTTGVLMAEKSPMTKPAQPTTQPAATDEGLTVSGRLLDKPGGKPLAGVTVTLKLHRNQSPSSHQTARTDKNGRYVFHDPKGKAYASVSIDTPKGVWCRGARTSFAVGTGKVQSPGLYLKTNQTVSGTVRDVKTGKPVPAALVGVSIPGDNPARVAADDDGRFTLYVLPRKLTVQCYGNVTSHYPPESNRTITVTVPPKRRIRNIDFKAPETPSFTGSVALPNGKPAKKADVDVLIHWPRPTSKHRYEGAVGPILHLRLQTDAEGEFRGYFRRSPYPDIPNIAPDPGTKVKMDIVGFTGDRSAGAVRKIEIETRAKDRKPIKLTLGKTGSATVRVVALQDSAPIVADVVAWRVQYVKGPHATTYGGAIDRGVTSKHIGAGRYLLTGLIPGPKYWFMLTARGYTWNYVYAHSSKKNYQFTPGKRVDLGTMRLKPLSKEQVLDFIKALSHPKEGTRSTAAVRLAQMYTAAKDADPALAGFIKARAIPVLLQLLRGKTSKLPRSPASRALGTICDCDPENIRALETWDEVLAWWWSFPINRLTRIESTEPSHEQLEALLDDLHSSKVTVKAWEATLALAGAGDRAVSAISKRVKPVSADADRIAALIGQLDNDKWAVRKIAEAELSVIGRACESALRTSLKGKLPIESRLQVRKLIEALSRPYPVMPQPIMVARAIRVLELIATPQAVQVLNKLAKGTDKAHTTQRAKAALKRHYSR